MYANQTFLFIIIHIVLSLCGLSAHFDIRFMHVESILTDTFEIIILREINPRILSGHTYICDFLNDIQ